MKLSRLARLRTILVVLGALLLGQWSIAAHACPKLNLAGPVPGEAHAALTALDAATAAATGCAHQDDSQSTLCYKHCNAEEQASGASTVVFAAPPPALCVARAAEPMQIAPQSSRFGLAHATAPPLTILYCVSLT